MLLKINGVEIAEYPEKFIPTILDIDDSDTSVRMSDGTLNRNRIAVKRQLEMSWGVLEWEAVSSILKAMENVFFDVYYPDIMSGQYETRTFYVGNRPAPFVVSQGGRIMWSGLKITLTEK